MMQRENRMQNGCIGLGEERHALAILAILNEAIVTSTALYDYVPRQPVGDEAVV